MQKLVQVSTGCAKISTGDPKNSNLPQKLIFAPKITFFRLGYHMLVQVLRKLVQVSTGVAKISTGDPKNSNLLPKIHFFD